MARAYGVNQVLNSRYKTLDFDGKWLDLIGLPEPVGSWIIWGGSFGGKSTLAFEMGKYLCNFGRVAYNSLEEGKCESVRRAFATANMDEVDGKLLLLDKEPIDELYDRLKRKKSPRFIFLDSLQYAGLTYATYKELIDEFRNKLFIWVSHADGKEPAGQVAVRARYDAFVKIYVEGFQAFFDSRYGGGREPYIIWQEGAEKYWGKKL